jgi:hypothetical protein
VLAYRFKGALLESMEAAATLFLQATRSERIYAVKALRPLAEMAVMQRSIAHKKPLKIWTKKKTSKRTEAAVSPDRSQRRRGRSLRKDEMEVQKHRRDTVSPEEVAVPQT